MSTARTIHLVVNPSSGRGRARRLLPKVRNTLATIERVRVEVHTTTNYDDARQATLAAALSARPGAGDSLVVMGGDGMAHLGLNACAEAHDAGLAVPLGVIPAGTGNDFCRGVGIPVDAKAATLAIVAGRTQRVDLAEARGKLEGGAERRFVGSVVSTGYDAVVNLATNNFRYPIGPLGPLAYGAIALAELARFVPFDYRITLDGRPRELQSVLVAVANAGWFGGGMHIVPPADVTDGLLDVLLVGPLARHDVLRLLPQLYAGRHVGHPAVEIVRASTVELDGNLVHRDGSRGQMFAMADGEKLGRVPLTLRARPGLIDVYRP
ncbi:diacylglycerol/lipid kinase family protein [Luteococcus sp. OSA5]|uniref:diacylglycerol/lipid kinase family protein n=1 Tax=Luteococcus sp. OSA5 TaxID=3401630 RepID=UPI003B429611